MKTLALLASAGAIAVSFAASANAEEVIKPLTDGSVNIAKSTQALPPVSLGPLGLGGLGAAGTTALIVGGIVATIVIIDATNGTN